MHSIFKFVFFFSAFCLHRFTNTANYWTSNWYNCTASWSSHIELQSWGSTDSKYTLVQRWNAREYCTRLTSCSTSIRSAIFSQGKFLTFIKFNLDFKINSLKNIVESTSKSNDEHNETFFYSFVTYTELFAYKMYAVTCEEVNIVVDKAHCRCSSPHFNFHVHIKHNV